MSYEKYYEDVAGLTFTTRSSEEWQCFCPFHNNKNTPAMSVNIKTGVWKCFGECDEGGNIIQFHNKLFKVNIKKCEKDIAVRLGNYKTISDDIVRKFQNELLQDDLILDYVIKHRGLNIDTITKYRIGWDKAAVTIPILDEDGYCVNIRKHTPTFLRTADNAKAYSYSKGFGSNRLFPLENLSKEIVFIVEGEPDCLLANQMGYNAVTCTAGAQGWDKYFNGLFKNKIVYICYDTDEPGKNGATNVAKNLYGFASKIYIINLPQYSDDKNDFSDYILKYNKTKEDFNNVIKDAVRYTVEKESVVDEEEIEDKEVYLKDICNSKYYNKPIHTKGLVSGKDITPYLLPDKLQVRCKMDQRVCKKCPLYLEGGSCDFEIPKNDNTLLKFIGSSDDKKYNIIGDTLSIPSICKSYEVIELEMKNAIEILVIPEISYASHSTEYTTRRMYALAKHIETNVVYDMKGITTTNPMTQQATQIINSITPTKSTLDNFVMTDEMHNELEIFKCSSVEEKLKDIYNELENSVTKIYERFDLLFAYDLVFHSPQSFVFNNTLVRKGYPEALVLGDTRTGKTESAIRLVEHYKLGEICTGENTSFAGLVGGMQQEHGRWRISWGKIPLNDSRLVLIDEAGNLTLDGIASMSNIRSSGVAEIVKIQTEKTNARTRLIWIANSRSGRKLENYAYGINAVKELIGKMEDISRFDFALLISDTEVPMHRINAIQTGDIQETKYTSKLCNNLILWAWTRKIDDIKFTTEATKTILSKAEELGNLYTPTIPLVNMSEQRIKLARLSVATACRVYNSTDGKTVTIEKYHVDFVNQWLQSIYNKPVMGYNLFSKMYRESQDSATKNSNNIIYQLKKLCEMNEGIDISMLASVILNASYFRRHNLKDQLGFDDTGVSYLMTYLTKNNLIVSTSNGYKAQPYFLKLLKGVTND